MADRQKSHFGSDGFKELRLREEAVKHTKNTYNSPVVERRKAKEKELFKLKREENKRKSGPSRSSKTIVPKGTGKRNIGEFR